MSRNSILKKLQSELQLEVTTERQVVYILVEIRKAIEQAGELENYFALDFYCSFALHTKMSRAGAKRILERFDRAYPLLVKKEEISRDLQKEIDQTTKLKLFRDQLKAFLDASHLPTRLFTEPDEWARFIHLYGNVIDECELVLDGEGTKLKHIDRVVVRLDVAPEILETQFGNQVLFRLRWICHGRDGGQGEHFVIFGYDPFSEPHGDSQESRGTGMLEATSTAAGQSGDETKDTVKSSSSTDEIMRDMKALLAKPGMTFRKATEILLEDIIDGTKKGD